MEKNGIKLLFSLRSDNLIKATAWTKDYLGPLKNEDCQKISIRALGTFRHGKTFVHGHLYMDVEKTGKSLMSGRTTNRDDVRTTTERRRNRKADLRFEQWDKTLGLLSLTILTIETSSPILVLLGKRLPP